MDPFLQQVTLHPWVAVLAGLAFLFYLAVAGRRGAAWARVVPGGLALALLALSTGIAASVRGVVGTFHAIALTGSGGEGSVAAGLGESVGVLLLGLISAILTLAAALFFSRRTRISPGEAEPGRDTGFMRQAVLISATLLSLLVAALSLYILWFIAAIPGWIRNTAGNAQSVSEAIGDHISSLSFLGIAAVAGSAALSALAHFFSGTRAPSSRQALLGRTLVILLLVVCLVGAVVAWLQFANFQQAAMTGRFS
jgi:hypothetical protein